MLKGFLEREKGEEEEGGGRVCKNNNEYVPIDNHCKCTFTFLLCSNKKTWNSWRDNEPRLIYLLSIRDPPQEDKHKLKVNGWKKNISCKWKGRKTWCSNNYIRKIGFKTKALIWDQEELYILIMEAIQKEDITLVNIYAPDMGAPQYVKQLLMDIKVRSTVIQLQLGDFNMTLTSVGRSSRQKVNEETVA